MLMFKKTNLSINNNTSFVRVSVSLWLPVERRNESLREFVQRGDQNV
jgi:hypothetical protein